MNRDPNHSPYRAQIEPPHGLMLIFIENYRPLSVVEWSEF